MFLSLRFLQILPGAMSWAVLLLPIFLALWAPRAVTIFIAAYIILWFLRIFKSSIFLLLSYRKSKQFEAIDWHKKLEENSLTEAAEKIRHLVIMPTFKEEKEILEESIRAISQVNFPLKQIIFVLATEERDCERAELNAEYLERRFRGVFGGFYHIMHPKNLPHEIPAKGANLSYAAHHMAQTLQKSGADFNNIIVTTLDADNRPHPSYFANLTYHFLMEPERHKRSFQPLPYFYNNIWEVPFANRIVALANTFWYLAESGEPRRLFNASVYAQSLTALKEVNFWSRQTIVEDLHQYWRMYFHFHGDHEVVPLFVPVYQDALQSKTYFTSLVGQYRQLRRWAWGASVIPFVITNIWRMRKTLPMFKSLSRLWYLWYLQIMWATAPFIVLFNKFIPTFLNPQFGNTIFVHNLGAVLNILFNIMLISIAVSLWISLISLPSPPGRHKMLPRITSLLQWLLLPFVTLFYGAIPALDAQTRLMLNKPLSFNVTEKIRKIG